MSWQSWEEEHGSGSGKGKDDAGGIVMTPYVGDPLCNEYEKFCAVGADLLKGLEGESELVVRHQVLDHYLKWGSRIQELADLLNDHDQEEE